MSLGDNSRPVKIGRWWLGVLAIVSAIVSVTSAQTVAPELDIETFTLPNGLKVALSPDPQQPLTTVCVTYHVGSKNERSGLTGFAHFFEHMMFRGTKNVPSYDVPLQEAGGSPNAFTSNDVTVYFETVPSSYLERALYMEAERMAFLPTALDPVKFNTEREIVKNERRQRMENVPYGLASEAISASVFPKGHPYSWSVIGTMEDLDNATLLDLRRFFWEFYHPGNATLTVVGNFDKAKARAWIEKYFTPLKRGTPIPKVEVTATAPVDKRMVQFDQVQFPRLYWAWPSVSERHQDAAALDVLATILSDGDASRLRQALVINSRLASQVSASSDTQELDGLFTVSATATPGTELQAIEKVLQQQIKLIQEDGVTEEEIKRALAKNENAVLQTLTSATSRAFIIGMGYAQYDNPHHYRTYITDYIDLTTDDVRRVAQKYLTSEKFVLSVVPPNQGEETPAILAGPLPSSKANREVAERLIADDPRWASLPASSEAAEIAFPEFERHTLKNGLEVWIAPWRTLPLVSVQLMIPAGAGDHPKAQAGLASLVARTWDKGTAEMTATEFAEALDLLGVALSVGAGTDTTQLGFSVGTSRLNETLALVGKLVTDPRFDATDVERERSLMLAALARVRDDPARIAARTYPRLLYGEDHPYGIPNQGSENTVKQLTADNVRAFYAANIRPQGATLIVAGDVETDELLNTLESTWGTWKGEVEARPRPAARVLDSKPTVFLVDKPEAVQSVLMVSRLWRDRNDASYYPATIGNRVIGGDFLSRINQNLREKNGFTYGARSMFRFRRVGSEWIVQTSVRADVTGAALKEMVAELDAARKTRPLTADELKVARDAELNALPEAFGTPSGIAASLLEMAIYGLPDDYLTAQMDKFASVTDQNVTQLMPGLLNPKRRVILVVGDRKLVEPQLKEAGFDNIKIEDLK